jgi:hypothetical protein
MKKMKGWIEIFRTGTHTSSNGKKKSWSKDALDKMVTSYDTSEHEAPIVIGHPKSNAPAYGWLEGVKRSGTKLLGKFKQVEPQFGEMVKAGRFKKRSISVYPDGSLRHVGFLGAQPPAVKGLRDFAFEEGDAEIYEFEEKEADMPTVEQLEKQLDDEKKKRKAAEKENADNKKKAEKSDADFAELQEKGKRKEIADFVDAGIKDGKILPVWKDKGLVDFMHGLNSQEETFEFSEGKKETPGEWFKGFINSFSEHPLFKEMAKPDGDQKQADADFAEDEKEAEEMAADHHVDK